MTAGPFLTGALSHSITLSLQFMLSLERSKDSSLVGDDGKRGGWLCDEVGSERRPQGSKLARGGHLKKRL